MHSAGATRATIAMRIVGVILAIIGLGPLIWAGIRNSELGVLRLAILDPLAVIALCAIAALVAPARVNATLTRTRDWLLRPSDRVFSIGLFVWIVGVAF